MHTHRQMGKACMACRGHVDSVNEVCWQPFSSSLCTASSDKTVSIWDARSGLCTQAFYGHHNSCNCVAFNCQVHHPVPCGRLLRNRCCIFVCLAACGLLNQAHAWCGVLFSIGV